MTDRLITLQLTAVQVGYIIGALKGVKGRTYGAAASLMQTELGDLLQTIAEQVEDDTLQGAGLVRHTNMRGETLGYVAPDAYDTQARLDEYERTEDYTPDPYDAPD